jgi:hypothetical protein
VADALADCLFFVGMGSNDYLNNYLMTNYNTHRQYNPQQFSDLLVQQYNRQLMVSESCNYLLKRFKIIVGFIYLVHGKLGTDFLAMMILLFFP